MAETAPRVPLRMQWMNACTSQDFELAAKLAPQILERNPADDFVRRGTARWLEVQSRAADALEHWVALRDADPADFEAAFHVLRAAVAEGMAPADAAAHAAPAANAVFQGALVDALLDPAPALEGEFTHVAISGVSFCGSTLLDRVLGGLPGVKSTGESHWLTKVRAETGYCDAIMSIPLAEARFVPCTVCGANCDVLSRNFRRSLVADNADWYRKIALRLGTRMLISADKGLRKLMEKDPLLEFSALVVFKSPEQAWRSQLDKLPKDRDAAYYEAECRKYMDVWAKQYGLYLHHFRPQGPVVFLNFDAFTQSPEALLRAVCDRLGLPFDAGVLKRTEPGHAIGGNARSMKRLRDKDYAVEIESLPDPALDPVHAQIIEDNATAQDVWRELMVRHQALAQHAEA